ncbi:hypothetical protein GCK32_010843 [Trichostrongylus colubriformis]|uniref:Uncharacterized protein n=1 Tax=Trichostrongylus colubriformis TaxID=6319 RepID=A0AAN8IBF7_TRICO
MWSILTLLAVFLTSAYAQDYLIKSISTGILRADVKIAIKDLSYRYNKNMVWDDILANEALKEVIKPYSVNAPLKIYRRMKIANSDYSLMKNKIVHALESSFASRKFLLQVLPRGTRYGCNGTYSKNGIDYLLSLVCIYKWK